MLLASLRLSTLLESFSIIDITFSSKVCFVTVTKLDRSVWSVLSAVMALPLPEFSVHCDCEFIVSSFCKLDVAIVSI